MRSQESMQINTFRAARLWKPTPQENERKEKMTVQIEDIGSIVTEPDLVAARRRQIVKAARAMFQQKGYHPTRVRDIAEAAGIATGTIYQYVRTKEDILSLVCEIDFPDWEARIRAAIDGLESPVVKLKAAIKEYYLAIFEVGAATDIVYREGVNLSKPRRQRLMEREEDIGRIFEDILRQGAEKGFFQVSSPRLAAHSILVLAQMWSTKRWSLREYISGIDEFIALQTEYVLGAVRADDNSGDSLPVGKTQRQ